MGVTIAVTRVAANTGTGTQDITTTDLGGLTPKAVLLIATRAVTDGTAVDGAGMYMGASDGTNEWTEGYESQHAQASMDSDHQQDTTSNRILTIYDGTADGVVEGTANFDSFITDGVRIDWTDAPAGAYLITATFFAGTDLSTNVGTVGLGNTGNALIAVTSVGFEADVLITAILEGTTVINPNISMGLVHNNRGGTVTQRTMGHKQRSGFGSGAVGMMMRNDSCIVTIQSTDTLDYYGTAQSFDSSGFDIQMGNSRAPGNRNMGWIALRFGASPVVDSKVYTYTTPTATGSNTDSNPGFEPQFVMYLANRAAAANTLEADADAGTFGIVMLDADDLYTQSISDEDGAADSNTQSLSDNIVNLPTHTGASGHQATLTSIGSTGPVWNYSATDTGTARLWGALAIEVFVSGTQYNQSTSGGITPSGDIFKQGNKVLAGTVTSSGLILKEMLKPFTGNITPLGGLLKQTNKIITGDVVPSGVLTTSRLYSLVLEGALSLAGSVLKATDKLLSGTFPGSGSLSKLADKLFQGNLNPSGTINKETTKSFSGEVNSSGTSNKQGNKQFSGEIISSGNITKSISKLLQGAISFAGDLLAEFSGGGTTFFKELSGELIPSGTITKTVEKLFSGVLSLAGNLSKIISKSFSGLVSIQGSVNKFVDKLLSGELTFSGEIQLVKTFIKFLEGSVSLSGTIEKTSNKNLSGAVEFSGSISKYIQKILSGELILTGTAGKGFFKELSGNLTLSGIVSYTTDIIVAVVQKVRILGSYIVNLSLSGMANFTSTLRGNKEDTVNLTGIKGEVDDE
jgi:hypothetical protein